MLIISHTNYNFTAKVKKRIISVPEDNTDDNNTSIALSNNNYNNNNMPRLFPSIKEE